MADNPDPFTFNDDGSFNLPDGSTVESLEELGKGYLRQSDYTTKTQAVSDRAKQVESAERLMQSLETNPQGTLKALAKNLGVELGTPTPAPEPPRQDDGWDSGWDDGQGRQPQAAVDPRIDRLMETVEALATEVSGLRGTQAKTSVEADLVRLQAENPDVQINGEDLVRHALVNNITDLDTAFKSFYHDQLLEVAVKKAKADEAVVDEKRDQARAVTPGAGAQTDAPAATPKSDSGDTGLDFRAALDETLKEYGVTDVSALTFGD